jgi:hypothetical protein
VQASTIERTIVLLPRHETIDKMLDTHATIDFQYLDPNEPLSRPERIIASMFARAAAYNLLSDIEPAVGRQEYAAVREQAIYGDLYAARRDGITFARRERRADIVDAFRRFDIGTLCRQATLENDTCHAHHHIPSVVYKVDTSMNSALPGVPRAAIGYISLHGRKAERLARYFEAVEQAFSDDTYRIVPAAATSICKQNITELFSGRIFWNRRGEEVVKRLV